MKTWKQKFEESEREKVQMKKAYELEKRQLLDMIQTLEKRNEAMVVETKKAKYITDIDLTQQAQEFIIKAMGSKIVARDEAMAIEIDNIGTKNIELFNENFNKSK